MIHSRMLAELDRADGGLSRSSQPARRAEGQDQRSPAADAPRTAEGEVLDVPEFIPPS
jgi:hypothetical protein